MLVAVMNVLELYFRQSNLLIHYHQYEYRFYVDIKYNPTSIDDSWCEASDLPKWTENIRANFGTTVWLDRGGSVIDFIKSIELRLKHLEQAGTVFNRAMIRESTENAVFKEAK